MFVSQEKEEKILYRNVDHIHDHIHNIVNANHSQFHIAMYYIFMYSYFSAHEKKITFNVKIEAAVLPPSDY